VLDLIASGESIDSILTDYPHLKREDVLACVAYAADHVRGERVLPLAS
jgi:uncharacterized protein (DUF433 family)